MIRLDFDDGDWGYVVFEGGGKYSLTKDPNEAMVCGTKEDAQDWYYDHIAGRPRGDGARVTHVYISTLETSVNRG